MVVEGLKGSSHEPIAMIRNPAQRGEFDRMGVPTVLGDLEYPIDHAMAECDAVIFAAGSGSSTGKDKTVLVDHIGAIKSVVAAQVNGVGRFVMLSSLNADIDSQSPIAHYHKAKSHADNFLRESGLDYSIVCPGRLNDDPFSGKVELTPSLHGKVTTSRANVAATLVSCLDYANTIGKSFGIADSESISLEESMAMV